MHEGREPVALHPAVVESDVTLVVGAAETVLHGGPGSLLAAADAQTIRRVAAADSLLEAAGGPEWELALAVESAVARQTALLGVSLVLDLPRLTGTYRGYPDDLDVVRRLSRSPFRALVSALPGPLRKTVLGRQGRGLTATAAYASRPSVAHAEALLRGVALRDTSLAEPLDALVVGVPWFGPGYPREPVNPVTAAALALGTALRLRRDAFPIRAGWDARARPLAAPDVRAGHARALRLDVPRAAGRARRPGTRVRGSRCPLRRTGARRVPQRLGLPSRAPLRRLGRLPAGALATRARDRRRLPRRRRRQDARLRAESRDRRARSRWPTASPAGAAASASCLRRPTRRSSSARRRGRSSSPARCSGAPTPGPRAGCARSP